MVPDLTTRSATYPSQFFKIVKFYIPDFTRNYRTIVDNKAFAFRFAVLSEQYQFSKANCWQSRSFSVYQATVTV